MYRSKSSSRIWTQIYSREIACYKVHWKSFQGIKTSNAPQWYSLTSCATAPCSTSNLQTVGNKSLCREGPNKISLPWKFLLKKRADFHHWLSQALNRPSRNTLETLLSRRQEINFYLKDQALWNSLRPLCVRQEMCPKIKLHSSMQ